MLQALSCPLAMTPSPRRPRRCAGRFAICRAPMTWASSAWACARACAPVRPRSRCGRPSGFPRAAAAKMLKNRSRPRVWCASWPTPARRARSRALEGARRQGLLAGAAARCALTWRMRPSFFQVNTAQAEKLMEQAIRMLGGSVGEGTAPEGPRRVARRRPVRGLRHIRRGHGARRADVIAVESAERLRCATCAATPTRTTSTSTS